MDRKEAQNLMDRLVAMLAEIDSNNNKNEPFVRVISGPDILQGLEYIADILQLTRSYMIDMDSTEHRKLCFVRVIYRGYEFAEVQYV